MKPLPKLEENSFESLVLRTDFSDDAVWAALCEKMRAPQGDFRADLHCVSDPDFAGLTAEGLTALAERSDYLGFAFLVDTTALVHPDSPILVVDLDAEPGRTFRVVPSEMWSVQNNLAIANMDFADFADAADADGIFRGFPRD